MKTAISLPDSLFESAEAMATRLGISRSQLYATALAEFIAEHEDASITARLDAVYAGSTKSFPDRVLAALQDRSLPREDTW